MHEIAGTSTNDHGDADRLGKLLRQQQIVALHDAITVDGVQKDFPRTQFSATDRMRDGIQLCSLGTATNPYFGRIPFIPVINAGDEALRTKTFGDLAQKLRMRHCGSRHDNLVRPRPQQFPDIFDRTYSSPRRPRPETLGGSRAQGSHQCLP